MIRMAIGISGLLLLCISLSGAEPPLTVCNWPAWRGPLANGTSPDGDPPVKWSEKQNVAWKAELPARGSASPIVWGNQVYVLSAVKGREARADELPPRDPRFETKTVPPQNFYRFLVTSFDRSTGKKRWEQVAAEKVPHEGHHDSHSYAGGSPTTDGKRLYVSFGSFGTFAYDMDGKLLWSRDFGRMRTRLGWGEAVTPVVHADTLILNYDQEVDSKLIALDAATGATKWEVARPEKTSWNTPLVIEHGGRTQVVVNATNKVRSYDLATGKPIWEVSGMTTNAIPSPVADDQRIYCMSGYRGSAVVAVPIDSVGDLAEKGKVAWRYGKGTPYVPSPLLYEGRLYFTKENSELLTVLDARSGKVLIDAERLPGLSSFYGSAVAASGRIYFVDQRGGSLVLKAGNEIEVLATNRLDDRFDSSPAIAGKQLFLRGEKYLYCIQE